MHFLCLLNIPRLTNNNKGEQRRKSTTIIICILSSVLIMLMYWRNRTTADWECIALKTAQCIFNKSKYCKMNFPSLFDRIPAWRNRNWNNLILSCELQCIVLALQCRIVLYPYYISYYSVLFVSCLNHPIANSIWF